MRDFPGGLVAKTAPSAGGAGSITGQETRSCMPQLRSGAAKLIIIIIIKRVGHASVLYIS